MQQPISLNSSGDFLEDYQVNELMQRYLMAAQKKSLLSPITGKFYTSTTSTICYEQVITRFSIGNHITTGLLEFLKLNLEGETLQKPFTYAIPVHMGSVNHYVAVVVTFEGINMEVLESLKDKLEFYSVEDLGDFCALPENQEQLNKLYKPASIVCMDSENKEETYQLIRESISNHLPVFEIKPLEVDEQVSNECGDRTCINLINYTTGNDFFYTMLPETSIRDRHCSGELFFTPDHEQPKKDSEEEINFKAVACQHLQEAFVSLMEASGALFLQMEEILALLLKEKPKLEKVLKQLFECYQSVKKDKDHELLTVDNAQRFMSLMEKIMREIFSIDLRTLDENNHDLYPFISTGIQNRININKTSASNLELITNKLLELETVNTLVGDYAEKFKAISYWQIQLYEIQHQIQDMLLTEYDRAHLTKILNEKEEILSVSKEIVYPDFLREINMPEDFAIDFNEEAENLLTQYQSYQANLVQEQQKLNLIKTELENFPLVYEKEEALLGSINNVLVQLNRSLDAAAEVYEAARNSITQFKNRIERSVLLEEERVFTEEEADAAYAAEKRLKRLQKGLQEGEYGENIPKKDSTDELETIITQKLTQIDRLRQYWPLQKRLDYMQEQLGAKISGLDDSDPQKKNIKTLVKAAIFFRRKRIGTEGEEELYKALDATNQYLDQKIDVETYQAAIEQASTHLQSFPWLNVVLGSMLAILTLGLLATAAILLIALATPAAPISAAILTPILSFCSTLSIAAMHIVAAELTVGVLAGAFSGFFANSAIKTPSIKKAMKKIEETQEEPNEEAPSLHSSS